ncbi:MAG: alpha,alpha-trehalase TreF [Saprospiraceae bacterium]|nr:alpha,alpha-trehalase TreF [Saprospiraceae bacterium]
MQPYDILFGELFIAVQTSGIFEDSKTFVDMDPRSTPREILANYEAGKNKEGFDLKTFVLDHFDLPARSETVFKSNTELNLSEHIKSLWPHLTRPADDPDQKGSLIPLPKSYIVPGGRFREIYYWDSYFTMLGLIEQGRIDMVENMVDNFAYLVDRIGFIPNGNRTYFLTRSQPPFFALMVDLLAGIRGQEIILRYLPFLQKEYDFWTVDNPERIVEINGFAFSRYWDSSTAPRQESYIEDAEMEGFSERLARDIRAACESGWDFSSRWMQEDFDLRTIKTSNIIPVDLNSLLFFAETMLRKGYALKEDTARATHFEKVAESRKKHLNDLFFDAETGGYFDYLIEEKKLSKKKTLAMLFPLFLNIAQPNMASVVAKTIQNEFLKAGGLQTTLVKNGQQWDAPNGWPPLQWVAVKGLHQYGFDALAVEIAERWTTLNERVFKQTGKMMEKYNVVDASLEAGGGEYPVQDGFGWTNGVYLAMRAFLA